MHVRNHPLPPRRRVALAIASLLAIFTCNPLFAEEKEQPQVGRFIPIELPITGQTYERTTRMVRGAKEQAARQRARLSLIFEFNVPKGREQSARQSDFGASYELANFISGEELAGVRTVAFLPAAVEGHAVLPAIACQEIIMSPGATLGPAAVDDAAVSPTWLSAYKEIASRRRTLPTLLVLGLLDRAAEVYQVQTPAGPEFVSAEGLAKLREQRAVGEPTVLKRAGEPGVLPAADARRLGLVALLAADRREAAKALGLPPAAVEDDPSLVGGWRPIRVDLKGPLGGDVVDRVQKSIEEQVRKNDVNFICLWIDSPGGSLGDAARLANFLAFDLDPSRVRTVAYVPNEARADAALVALACDQLVMHSRATLGGPGARTLNAENIAAARELIHQSLAPRKGRSWSLPAALFDPNLAVYRCSRGGETEYFCEEELKEQPDADKWKKDMLVTTPGQPLALSGTAAEERRVANRVINSFPEFKRYYGLENDPTLVEPGWAETLIDALASPGVAVLLFLIGGAALYIELHTPGIGIGGFTAAVCFLLFFWSRYLGGTAGWLEVTLFLAGVSCLLLEIFVIPGFGIFGLGGGAMVLASLVLASQTFIWPSNQYQFDRLLNSLLSIAAAAVGLIIVAVLLRRRLPRSRLFGRMMLAPPEGEEAETIRRREALADFADLVGRRGTTATPLMPGGKARFGDLLVDVLADGEFIGRGAAIEVVEVRGSRVLVKEVASG
jgi:membrane-bound serine protease (ClpP class)